MAQFPAIFSRETLSKFLIPLIANRLPSAGAGGKRRLCCDREESVEYEFSKPTKVDYPECIKLMWETYIAEEPIVKYLQLTKTTNNPLDEYICRCLSQGLSLMVKSTNNVDDDGQIVGVCVNAERTFHESEILERYAETMDNAKLEQLFKFWAFIQKVPNPGCCRRSSCLPKVFEIAHLFVRDGDKELGNELARRSIRNSIQLGYPIVRLNATTAESASIAEGQGMDLFCELPYSKYFRKNIESLTTPVAPDQSLKIYVKMS